MSTLVPNVPIETTQPQLSVNSRELGFGFFQIALRVRDNDGNVSTNPTAGVVFVSRGEGAVAVLRSPSLALLGQPIPLYGAESFTKGGGRVVVYVWTLTPGSGDPRRFETRAPTVVIGGPSQGPNDPLPRNLPAGKYGLSLTVRDDSGGESEPDIRPLTIVANNRVGRRPVAVGRALVDRRFVDQMTEGTRFELDGSDSAPSSPPAGPEIRRYLWTWLPFMRTTPDSSPWKQESSREPIFRPDWKLVPGVHRLRLVVFDAQGIESAPTDLVVRVVPLQ